MPEKAKCTVVDLECHPPKPCEAGDEGHIGPHFWNIPKDAPNHPEAGQRRFFTGLDPVNAIGSEIKKQVELAALQQRAKAEQARAIEAGAVAEKAAAALEASINKT